MPGSATRGNALDHVVVVLFENRSLDNVLGRLYGPGDGKIFDGVIGKDLSNPIPEWAEHGAHRKMVPVWIFCRSQRAPVLRRLGLLTRLPVQDVRSSGPGEDGGYAVEPLVTA